MKIMKIIIMCENDNNEMKIMNKEIIIMKWNNE